MYHCLDQLARAGPEPVCEIPEEGIDVEAHSLNVRLGTWERRWLSIVVWTLCRAAEAAFPGRCFGPSVP
jgi:hypothetical protein